MFKSVQLDAVMSGVSCILPEKTLCTTLVGPCSDDPVNDFTVISTLGITTLSIAVKIESRTQFLTAVTTLLISFLNFFVIVVFMVGKTGQHENPTPISLFFCEITKSQTFRFREKQFLQTRKFKILQFHQAETFFSSLPSTSFHTES